MNPGTLIIPDIHTEHEWTEAAISALAPDRVVFLGDYFDAAGSDVASQKATAEWLSHSLEQPNRIHLLGNHDVHYAFGSESFRCQGYMPEAYAVINSVLGAGWGERLHLHHWEQGHLLTHAGVHPELWPGSQEEFDAAVAVARTALIQEIPHPLLRCGNDRGGVGRSGLFWLDFHWSFEPIPGVPQIVGHTKCLANARHVGGKFILEPECIRDAAGTENWNLDTKCAWLGCLSQGRFERIENTWKGTAVPKLKSLESMFWDTD